MRQMVYRFEETRMQGARVVGSIARAKISGVIPLTVEARRHVIQAAKILGDDATYANVTKATGYNFWAVMDCMNRDKKRCKKANDKPKKPAKPKYIQEIEAATGLKCHFVNDTGHDTEWIILSPKKVPLFRVFGSNDLIDGISPCSLQTLQGISIQDRNARRRGRKLVD